MLIFLFGRIPGGNAQLSTPEDRWDYLDKRIRKITDHKSIFWYIHLSDQKEQI